MAVLDEIPGLRVEVIDNGTPFQEYDDDEEEVAEKNVTKYIEATSGAEFGVHYTFSHDFDAMHSIATSIHLDGKFVDGAAIDTEGSSFRRNLFYRHYAARGRVGNNDVHGVGEELKQTWKDVGTISVSFHWVNCLGSNFEAASIPAFSTFGTIPEKALKGSAVSHEATLGAPKPIAAFKSRSVEWLYDKVPFATYAFKYRSKGALKSLLVIPRSPSPVPIEESNIDDLSPEEMRARLIQIERERKEVEAAACIVKQEGMERKRARDPNETANGEGSFVDDDEISFVSAKRRKLLPSTINEDGVETFDLT